LRRTAAAPPAATPALVRGTLGSRGGVPPELVDGPAEGGTAQARPPAPAMPRFLCVTTTGSFHRNARHIVTRRRVWWSPSGKCRVGSSGARAGHTGAIFLERGTPSCARFGRRQLEKSNSMTKKNHPIMNVAACPGGGFLGGCASNLHGRDDHHPCQGQAVSARHLRVSGEKLGGSMGEPYVFVYEGQR